MELTPTEQKILALLSDGEEHAMRELIRCLPDWEMGSRNAVASHINNLRSKLDDSEVQYVRHVESYYRLVQSPKVVAVSSRRKVKRSGKRTRGKVWLA